MARPSMHGMGWWRSCGCRRRGGQGAVGRGRAGAPLLHCVAILAWGGPQCSGLACQGIARGLTGSPCAPGHSWMCRRAAVRVAGRCQVSVAAHAQAFVHGGVPGHVVAQVVFELRPAVWGLWSGRTQNLQSRRHGASPAKRCVQLFLFISPSCLPLHASAYARHLT